MNANNAINIGKVSSIFVVAIMVLTSFAIFAESESTNDYSTDQEVALHEMINDSQGVALGFAPDELHGVYERDVPQVSFANGRTTELEQHWAQDYYGNGIYADQEADGWFYPAKQPAGDAKILVVDDVTDFDYLSALTTQQYVLSSLNQGGFSYDVFQAGNRGLDARHFPYGDAGLSIMDDYEAVIWNCAENYNCVEPGEMTMSDSESLVLQMYLDGECGDGDSFCTTNRNVMLMTQNMDVVFQFNSAKAYGVDMDNDGSLADESDLIPRYFKAETCCWTGSMFSGQYVWGGTSVPMTSESGSIFDDAGLSSLASNGRAWEYPSWPSGYRPCDLAGSGCTDITGNPVSQGSIIFDYYADESNERGDGKEYDWHAVEYDGDFYNTFLFAEEPSVFDTDSDRLAFFETVMDFFSVSADSSATAEVDLSITHVYMPVQCCLGTQWNPRQIEADTPMQVEVEVTNNGYLTRESVSASLQLVNQYDQIMYSITLSTDAFAGMDGHAMNIGEGLLPGDSVMFTFNADNYGVQTSFDGGSAIGYDPMFTSSGFDHALITAIDSSDSFASNDHMLLDSTVARIVDSGEPVDALTGATAEFGADASEWDGNYDYTLEARRVSDIDEDQDGCWADNPDTENDESCQPRVGQGYDVGTDNWTRLSNVQNAPFHQDLYQYGFSFTSKEGWYKEDQYMNDNVDGVCDYDDSATTERNSGDTESDDDCIKFAPPAGIYQWVEFSTMDLSAMENVVMHAWFKMCQAHDSALVWQISNDGGGTWDTFWVWDESIWSCLGMSYWGHLGSLYQYDWLGANMPGAYFGDETNYQTKVRFVALNADDDEDLNGDGYAPEEMTECNSICVAYGAYAEEGQGITGHSFDQFRVQGSERISRDVTVTDVSVRDKGFLIEDEPSGEDKDREINITVQNLGTKAYEVMPIELTVTDMQGNDVTNQLTRDGVQLGDPAVLDISLSGEQTYGNVEENPDDTALFMKFTALEPNTYTLTATAVPGDDQIPTNNGMSATFRILDSFFVDDAQEDGSVYNTWFEVKRNSASDVFADYEVKNSAGQCNSYLNTCKAWFYGDVSASGPSGYGPNGDYSFISPSSFDRDGSGNMYGDDAAIDLRAAFEPILTFGYMTDLGNGDRMEVRATSEGVGNTNDEYWDTVHWDVLAEFTGSTPGFPYAWNEATIDLSSYAGEIIHIDFRVITDGSDEGDGIALDEIAVLGNEYANNIGISGVDTDSLSAANEAHDLSVTVTNRGTVSQDGSTDIIRVSAAIYSVDDDMTPVWEADPFTVPVEMAKGDSYTVSSANPAPGSGWMWGADLDPGIYNLVVSAELNRNDGTADEDGSDNSMSMTLMLGATLMDACSFSDEDDGHGDHDHDSDHGCEEFAPWNSDPYLVVSADYDMNDAMVSMDVCVHDDCYDVLNQNTGGESFYGDGAAWTGTGSGTYWARLGDVVDNDGNKLINTDAMNSDHWGVEFSHDYEGDDFHATAYVLGLNQYEMDVTGMSGSGSKAVPTSATGLSTAVPFEVTVRNLGASSDQAVVNFAAQFPSGSQISLDGGEVANLYYVGQDGGDTVVAIQPPLGFWGTDTADPRNGDGDNTAFIDANGVVAWPSGTMSQEAPHGWDISNPSKSSWGFDKPLAGPASGVVSPGASMSMTMEVTAGLAEWAPPGTYSIQADACTWATYSESSGTCDGQFQDADGQADMIIDKPDLSIGSFSWTMSAFGYVADGQWVKQSGPEGDSLFHFEAEILNDGTETVGTVTVGIESALGLTGVQIGLTWTGDGWATDGSYDSFIDSDGHLHFAASAYELGIDGPAEGQGRSDYTFNVFVDCLFAVDESDEGNNKKSFTITAVRQVITTPSFGLTALSMMVSGLIAAVGISLRNRREEDH